MRPSATSSASLPDKIDLKPAPEGRFFIDRRTRPDYNASVTFRLDKGDFYEADHLSRAAGLSLRRDRRYFLGLFRHLRSISFLQFSCAAAVAFLYAAVFHRHYSDGSGPAAPPRCLPGHLEGPPARSASGGLRYFRPHGLPVRLYHGYFLFQCRHHNGSANSEPGFLFCLSPAPVSGAFPRKSRPPRCFWRCSERFCWPPAASPVSLSSPLPDFSGALPQRGPLYCTVCCRQSSWSAMTGRPSPPSAWRLPP